LLSGVPLTAAATAIFLCTLTLVIVQPRGISIGWWAGGGALLTLGIGVDQLANVAAVWGIVWNATATFVAVIVISLVLDGAGFFEWAALRVLRAAHGHTLRAFFFASLLGALVAAMFANDGAALIITPIVYQQMRVLGFTRQQSLPFVMAAGFIADTASLPLVVSNLVNIVSANYFHIGFVTYAATMLPVDLVSCGASMLVLSLYYRRALPPRYEVAALPPPSAAIRDCRLFKAGWVFLLLLLAGYLVSEPLHLPVSLFAATGAAGLILLARGSATLSAAGILRRAPWTIVVFSLGMYLVVHGLRNAGLTNYLSQGLSHVQAAGIVPSAWSLGWELSSCRPS
jgi:arsenical pump membrane protein